MHIQIGATENYFVTLADWSESRGGNGYFWLGHEKVIKLKIRIISPTPSISNQKIIREIPIRHSQDYRAVAPIGMQMGKWGDT